MKPTIEKEWVTKEGHKAIVVFNNNNGFRCGYVIIEEDFNKSELLKDLDTCNIDVHGGITFEQKVKSGEEYFIEINKDSYMFGFDCGHCFDLNDFDTWEKNCSQNEDMMKVIRINKGIFLPSDEQEKIRTLDYCIEQCNNLSSQLNDYMNKGNKK